MKSIYINPIKLNAVLNGGVSLTSPVGFAYDVHNTGYTVFVATQRETGEVTWTERGTEVKFNLRKSTPRAQRQG